MERQTLAMHADVAEATRRFALEMNQLRARHGFDRVTVTVSNTAGGSKVQLELNANPNFELDANGEYVVHRAGPQRPANEIVGFIEKQQQKGETHV